MEEREFKTVKGKIDKWSMEPKKAGGRFLKVLVNGKTYNFFDTEFFEQNEAKFKFGNDVEITYWDSPWTGEDGVKRVSHTVEKIEFSIENPTVQKPVTEFAKASEVPPVQEDDIETIMKKCVRIAVDITDKYKDDDGNCLFSSDNVIEIAIAMFKKRAWSKEFQ
jgi:hypothetical protein